MRPTRSEERSSLDPSADEDQLGEGITGNQLKLGNIGAASNLNLTPPFALLAMSFIPFTNNYQQLRILD